jgi:hypothetical protein
MWQLTIHCLFCLWSVLLIVVISGIMCARPTIFPTLKTCKARAARDFLTCTNLEKECKLPEFLGIVVNTRENQRSTKASFSFQSLILNSHCSCHVRWPVSAPWHLPGHFFTQTQLFHQFPPRQLWLPVHPHIWDLRSPSKSSTRTIIPWKIQSSIACSCSFDIYVLLQLFCLINFGDLLFIATRCVASRMLLSIALKSFAIASGWFPSQRFWGPMSLGSAYNSGA